MERQDRILYYLDNSCGYRSHFNTRCKWGVFAMNLTLLTKIQKICFCDIYELMKSSMSASKMRWHLRNYFLFTFTSFFILTEALLILLYKQAFVWLEELNPTVQSKNELLCFPSLLSFPFHSLCSVFATQSPSSVHNVQSPQQPNMVASLYFVRIHGFQPVLLLSPITRPDLCCPTGLWLANFI